MARGPDDPVPEGIGMPKTDPGMNKIPTSESNSKSDKKAKSDKKKRHEKVLARLKKRFERCAEYESEQRKKQLEDRKFKAGNQWPADVLAARNADKRPALTVNKLPTFVHQITNDQRQNRPSINVSPVGDRGDVEAAKMWRGAIRQIERASSADIAYDTAFDDAVTSGIGYFRVLTQYESPETFDQTLIIQRVRNPFTVYLDPDHQEPDGADCKYGFISEMVPNEEFDEQWPDATRMPFSQAGTGESKIWTEKGSIRIVEYYEIQNEMRDLVALSNGWTGWKDEIAPEVQAKLDSGQMEILRERKSEVPKCTWYKATQTEILEETPWLGQWIPIVKVIGDEMDVEGKVEYSGIVRNAKDAQRQYNYWVTAETEMIALSPKAPFIMEEGQVEGHDAQWKQANTKSYPYLLYKAVNVNGKPAPPPQRQPFAGVPAGIVSAKQGAAQDMMATTGVRFDATLQERTVDESGRALRELRRSSDIGSFHYVDNLQRSLKHLGRILVDLIPKVMDTRRILTILREDDTEEQVRLDPTAPKAMQETKNPETGKTLKIFNPTVGKYGVTVTIGPSYATKRIEAAQSMMDFARALPNTAQLIADLIAKASDWPGADEIARRLAKAVPPHLLSPDQKDVPPAVQAMLTGMDQQIKQLSAERMQLMKALNDETADRALKQDSINKTFEARLLAIVQKAEASFTTQLAGKVDGLVDAVNSFMQQLSPPQGGQQQQAPGPDPGQPPPIG